MKKTILWDVDTQRDFMEPTGKLSVPNAETIRKNLKTLTSTGATKARLSGSVDAHTPNDPEFNNWPEHCVRGTPGQHKIPETLTANPLYIPSEELTQRQLEEALNYPGQVIFEKQDNDVRTNKNAAPILKQLQPDQAIIYGVVTEICVNQAVEFIAGTLQIPTIVVTDAIKELDQAKAEKCTQDWTTLGVRHLNTAETLRLLQG